MELLCWNIQHGGGARRARLVEEITAYDPDVIALTSFRAKPGEALCADLSERGWDYCETSEPAENRNGIAVFSRSAMRRARPCPAPPGESARWLDVDFPEFGFGMGVLHIMAGGSARNSPATIAKVRLWDAVVEAAEDRLHEPFLLVGDWNTGAHRLDEAGSEFTISGVQNKALRALFPQFSSGQMSRIIRRLRTHGLIKKASHFYKYYLTVLGKQVVALGLKLKELVIIPELAAAPSR